VHRVELTFAGEDDVPEPAIRAAEGVEDVKVAGRVVTCSVRGSIDPLLLAIRDARVVELVSTEPSLEEVFLSHFAAPKPKALGD